jgi:lysozyme
MLIPTKIRLRDQLEVDEGIKYTVYDDATGKPILPGTTVIGHPTIGVGRRLDFPIGISHSECDSMLSSDIDSMDAGCDKTFSWYEGLSEVRKSAICNICFNIGIHGFSEFTNTISLIEASNWQAAYYALLASKWAVQVGDRAKRIATQILNG